MMSPAGQYILGMRMKELNAQTLAVSLRAASTLASSIRFPNGVNKTSELRDFTGYARGGGTFAGSNKAERVFQSVQLSLTRHSPPELINIILSRAVRPALSWLPTPRWNGYRLEIFLLGLLLIPPVFQRHPAIR